ncbi:MAG TPA: cache domain-containing protein [Burkholderiales bacterium]|nr:cache domain-containing protein [Burkholderiales bacterium]
MGTSGRLRLEILAGCAILLLGLWAGIALLVVQAHRQAVDSAVANGRNLARSLAEYQDSSVRAIDLSLQQLREHWQRDPATFGEAVARHEDHLSKERVIQVAVTDREGWTLYSRLPQPGPLNFADRRYFQVQKSRNTDELHVSEPVLGRITRQWAIQVTRPLFDADKRFAGIIVVAVPPPALELVLQDIQLGEHGVIVLARADGKILARTGGIERAVQVTLAGWPGVGDDSPPGGDFRAPGPVDDIDRFFAYRKLQNYPLTIFLGQGAQTVLQPYYRDRNVLLGAGALATILLLALAALLVARARERARFVEERERVMLELHDSSIQSIYAIGLTLESCRRMLEKSPAQAAQALADAGANLNLVIQDLRAFITGERHGAYSEQEFMSEIGRIVPPADQGAPRFSVDVDRALVADLTPRQAEHVLRIAREAVSNVVRHANARNARLVLQRRGDRGRLEVSDDGIGLTAQGEERLGLGLHHIEARARKLRGSASVQGLPAQGTRVAVEFPCRS